MRVDLPIKSNASSKYCLRFAWLLSRTDNRLYTTPEVRWSITGDGDCWLVVTFNTRVIPMVDIPSRSSASLLLPRYKNGSNLVSGCVSIISLLTSCGQLPLTIGGAGNSELSHISLCREWNSLWPPAKTKRTNVIKLLLIRHWTIGEKTKR